ncbi:MAG: hypothetical protein R3E89_18125 [Thiolinea sp.]
MAQQNARKLKLEQIRFLQSDWFNTYLPTSALDVILSNPPYIALQDPHLQQGDVRFEPSAGTGCRSRWPG